MGNKSSRQKPLCIPLEIYEENRFINNYVITDYNTQVYKFPNQLIICFKFFKEDETGSMKLRLRFDDQISVDRDNSYKEGDTMYIKLQVDTRVPREYSFGYDEIAKHEIYWQQDLKRIKVTYNLI